MAVSNYKLGKKTFWKVDFWVRISSGQCRRIQKRKIPSKELATAFEAKARAMQFEGQYFETKRRKLKTVAQLWDNYKIISERDHRSWETERGRAAHLERHLGKYVAEELTARHVEAYRSVRLRETTVRGRPPSVASLNREVGLLKRMINYAVRNGDAKANPISHVTKLKENNIRHVVIDEEKFQQLYIAAEAWLKPILTVAFDTGMRQGEILNLTWQRVNLSNGTISLRGEDTKTASPRLIVLTSRVIETLKALPRPINGGFVFRSRRRREKEGPLIDIRKGFARACEKAGIPQGLDGGIIFHDLRRAFVTNARRAGVPESVVMKMSGHKTREIFDRYNVIDDTDVRSAVSVIEQARGAAALQ